MSATQTTKTKKTITLADALASASLRTDAGKCAILEDITVADARKLCASVTPAGAVAPAKDLISIGSYVLSDALTTLVALAGEFNFDAEVVDALVDMRKDAHEGADVSRTDEKVSDARLVGDEIDALRKDRRERSKASRAERAECVGRAHGGLGENLVSLFTFGGYTRSLNERYGDPR